MIPGTDDRSFNELMRTWPSKAILYLCDHYYEGLVQIAERRTYDRKASESIVREALIELWEKSGSISRSEGFLAIPYVVNLVKKKSFVVYRHNLTQADDRWSLLERLMIPEPSREYELMQSDKYSTLQLIVASMPVRQKQCIEMRFLKEMSTESIAIRLSTTQKIVEKNISRGLRRLLTGRSAMR
ncbi:MAG TPA: sigma-70 family RNA polymerase sigma factor [Chryseolinea sp.]|nr:sigma-70 family RNA polymerase sigma factor [Chryseolinea sp.]